MMRNTMPNVNNHRVAKKLSLKNKVWNYRGEGNANLVLSLVEERKIIRLRKSLAGELGENQMWLEMDFCRWVMQPLLGDSFVKVPVVVYLPETELADLNERLRTIRPALRHNKGLYMSHASVFPDFSFLPKSGSTSASPTFCVEVKPKQGWIPYPDRRLSKCTFCLNQYLKLKRGHVKEKSRYCPLDLFSGNRVRMKTAISALLACPQNNFRMFKNGVLVYDDATSDNYTAILEDWFGFSDAEKLVDNFTSLVVDALVSNLAQFGQRNFFSDVSSRIGEKLAKTEFPAGHAGPPRVPQHLLDEAQSLLSGPSCYKDFEPLPNNCVLSQILKVQKLDVMGSDHIHYLYRSYFLDDFSYVYELLFSSRNILKPINSYLLSTTVKDCSILMAFQRTSSKMANNQNYIKDSNGVCYSFNIGLSDLDPKPASCIEKHRKRDYDIVVNCIDVLRAQKKF